MDSKERERERERESGSECIARRQELDFDRVPFVFLSPFTFSLYNYNTRAFHFIIILITHFVLFLIYNTRAYALLNIIVNHDSYLVDVPSNFKLCKIFLFPYFAVYFLYSVPRFIHKITRTLLILGHSVATISVSSSLFSLMLAE